MSFQKILVAYDGSPSADMALETAKQIAFSDDSITVDLVHAIFIPYASYEYFNPDQVKQSYLNQGNEILGKADKRLYALSAQTKKYVIEGEASDAITRFAKEQEYDLIVMGSRGLSGIKELFLGSVSHMVAQKSDIPVLIIKADAESLQKPTKILVAYDGTDTGDQALQKAIDYANLSESVSLHVIHVIDLPKYYYDSIKTTEIHDIFYRYGHETIGKAEYQLSKQLKSTQFLVQILEGRASDKILEYAAEQDCDMIVVGSRGLTGTKEFFLGSISHSIAHRSSVPVLIARHSVPAR